MSAVGKLKHDAPPSRLHKEDLDVTRFVICLDGTWNNAATEHERADGSKVYRPTNVLKLARATRLRDDQGQLQIAYYDTGIGSMNRAPSGAARIVRAADNILGGALGAGFEINIEEAYTFLTNNWTPGDEIFIFGFSRGAAQARSLCRFIEWAGGFPVKADAFYVPKLYTEYLDGHGRGSAADFWDLRNQGRRAEGRALLQPIAPARVRYLGVWDTVLALGSRFRPSWMSHPEKTAFHTPATPPANVDRVRHALAIDERRHDFQAEIFAPGGQDVEQRWFAGVHSNVGGGLSEDGLANCALRWIVDEAKALGLAVDDEFLHYYRPFPMGRASKKTKAFAAADTVLRPLRGFKGERDLLAVDGMTLDPSVITRLNADASAHDTMDGPYRPTNLLRYLAHHPELEAQLSDEVRRAVAGA